MARYGDYPFLGSLDRSPRQRRNTTAKRSPHLSGHYRSVIVGVDLSQTFEAAGGGIPGVLALWDTDNWDGESLVWIDLSKRITWGLEKFKVTDDELGNRPYTPGYGQEVVVSPAAWRYRQTLTNAPVHYFGTTQLHGKITMDMWVGETPKEFGLTRSSSTSWRDIMENTPYWPNNDDELNSAYTSFFDTSPFNGDASLGLLVLEPLADMKVLQFFSQLRAIGKQNKYAKLVNGIATFWLLDNFVVTPTVSDIDTLLKLPIELHKKVRELDSLTRGKTVRKRKLVSRETTVWKDDRSLRSRYNWGFPGKTSSGSHLKVYYRKATLTRTVSKWVIGHWKATVRGREQVRKLSRMYTDRPREFKQLEYAAKLVGQDFGRGWVTVGQLWELIPFSWLVDYFVNVGQVLQALDNEVLVRPHGHMTCIKRQKFELSDPKMVCNVDIRASVFAEKQVTVVQRKKDRNPSAEFFHRVPIDLSEAEGETPHLALSSKGPWLNKSQLANLLAVAKLMVPGAKQKPVK